VPSQVDQAIATYLYCDVVPRHSWQFATVNSAGVVLSRSVDIPNPKISIVGALPVLTVIFCFTDKVVFLVIHSAVADVQPTKKSNLLIDDNNLFVMAPQKRNEDKVGMS